MDLLGISRRMQQNVYCTTKLNHSCDSKIYLLSLIFEGIYCITKLVPSIACSLQF